MTQQAAYVKYVPGERAGGVTVTSKFFFMQVNICLTGTMMVAWLKTFARSNSHVLFLETCD
jgi:hypothetical protein